MSHNIGETSARFGTMTWKLFGTVGKTMTSEKVEYLLNMICRIEGITYDAAVHKVLTDGLSIYNPLMGLYLDGTVDKLEYKESDGKLYPDKQKHGLTPH